MSKKVIAVVGATGAQGGSVVRALIKSGNYEVRALTRDPNSEKAKKLTSLGQNLKLVKAELDDVASLKKAFAGAYGAFLVTNFWEHFSVDKEQLHFRNLSAAAKDAGVKHVIASVLEDTRDVVPVSDQRIPTLKGKFKVPHFDGKGEIAKVIAKEIPCTLVYTSFYYENFIYFGLGPQKDPSGKYILRFNMAKEKLAMMSIEDFGLYIAKIFGDASYIGKSIGFSSEQLTCDEIAAAFSSVLGKKVEYKAITRDEYAALGTPGADDMANMFAYYVINGKNFQSFRDVEKVKKISPVTPFKTWLEKNKQAFAKL